MERRDAIKKLRALKGKDLRQLASQYEVTVKALNGRVNKGWAGHVLERYLGLPINSAQSPNFGSWELKCIPLKYLVSGTLSIKETMAITMIDPYQVIRTPFKDSHLLQKIKKVVIVARTVGKTYDEPTFIHSVTEINLKGENYKIVEKDYEEVRQCLKESPFGIEALSGVMGTYIQPRTKGAGHGSKSRAFYARPIFLRQYIKL